MARHDMVSPSAASILPGMEAAEEKIEGEKNDVVNS
jgi:hypothetical protein